MNAAVFPVAGVAFAFGAALPAAALVARGVLGLLRRHEAGIGARGPSAIRYALLIAPTAIPLGWIVSACLHQAETGTDPTVCAIPDAPGSLCPEVAALALAVVAIAAAPALWGMARGLRKAGTSHSREAQAARARLAQLAAAYPDLKPLLRRLVVTDSGEEPISARGIFAPRVVVHARFVRDLDDAALHAALRHEAEHVRHRDALRYFLARWALGANPLGRRLLEPEFARWMVAREAHCDREAVLAGASAPALAHALVAAARFSRLPGGAAPALRPSDVRVLRMRVDLLMAYADELPRRARHHSPALRFAACALLLGLVLPHGFGAGPLDRLHYASESAISLLSER